MKMEQAPKPAETPKPKPKSKTMLIVAAVIIVIIVIAGVYYALPYIYPSAPTYAVSILDDNACASGAVACKFNPNPITVPRGNTVVWTNKGNAPHTVHSCDSVNNPGATNTAACPNGNNQGGAANVNFASGTLNAGQTFQKKLDTAGTYQYYCNIHLWMHANVTVT